MDIDELIVDRTRWRRCLRNCKEGIDSDTFIQGRTKLVQLTRSIVTLACRGVKIPDFKPKAGRKSVDISAEITNFFRAIVGRPAQQYRSITIQKHVTPEELARAHSNIRSIVSPAKDAFHEMGDVLAGRLMELRTSNTNGNVNGTHGSQNGYSSSSQSQIARIATGLIHVIMHLSDCARYEEKPERSLNFAEFIRTVEPDNAEAHMRIALNLPLVNTGPDDSVGGSTLQAFFHNCVFLSNRGVRCDSPEAKVVENAAILAKQRAFVLDRQASAPDKMELFAARFIAAAWTILTCELPAARKAAVNSKENGGNAKLWAALADIAMTDKKGADRLALEEALIHAVGIAIFVRYRLSRQGNFNTAVDEKRTAAADAFLRNISTSLCDAVHTSIDRAISTVRRRHKNRGRVRQRKRRKLNINSTNNNSVRKKSGTSSKQQHTALPQLAQDELRMGAFEEVASMDMMPSALGALAALCHFWSKTMDSMDIEIVERQLKQFVALYRKLKTLGKDMERLQEVSGTALYWARIRSTLMTHTEVPSLAEDIHLCNFGAARDVQLFKNRVHMKIPADSFLKIREHANDNDINNDHSGLLNRAVHKLGRQKYETIVSPACRRHLEAFAQRISKKVASAASGMAGGASNSNGNRVERKELASTAACALVMFAIRKQRVVRMTRYLETYQEGIIKAGATAEEEEERRARHIHGAEAGIDDVLETAESHTSNEELSQMPGQTKRCARRNSSEDVDSAYYVRNLAKRRKVAAATRTAADGNSAGTTRTGGRGDSDVCIQVTQASHCSATGSSGVSTISPPGVR